MATKRRHPKKRRTLRTADLKAQILSEYKGLKAVDAPLKKLWKKYKVTSSTVNQWLKDEKEGLLEERSRFAVGPNAKTLDGAEAPPRASVPKGISKVVDTGSIRDKQETWINPLRPTNKTRDKVRTEVLDGINRVLAERDLYREALIQVQAELRTALQARA